MGPACHNLLQLAKSYLGLTSPCQLFPSPEGQAGKDLSRLDESLLSASPVRGVDGGKEQTVPVVLFPVAGFLKIFVLPLLLFKFRVMTLPGSVPFVGRDKLVAHFMINSEFQNTQGYKVLLQPRMNPDDFFPSS